MFDKKEYREIIRQGQMRRGYISKPSFEDKLKEILDDSFDELLFLLKNKEEDVDEIFEKYYDKDINELSDEEIVEYEKCSPEYIQNLPGSLRSTDPQELQSRVDAIDKRLEELDDELEDEYDFQDFAQGEIDKAQSQIDEAQKNLDDYHKQEDDWIELDEKMQGKAYDKASKIRDDWDKFSKDYEVPDTLSMLVRTIDDSFEHKGHLDSNEVDGLHDVADMLDDYANDMEVGLIGNSPYAPVHKIASDIRDFADEFDINNSPQGDSLVEIMDIASKGLPSEWEDTIEVATEIVDTNTRLLDESVKSTASKEKERDDLRDNRDKTERKLTQAERNLYNVP